jgi:hypothetical protein
VTVNAHGGLMESPFRMIAGQRITLVNPQSGKEVGCTVVSVHRSPDGYFATGFEFEQHSPQFWAVAFPSLGLGNHEGTSLKKNAQGCMLESARWSVIAGSCCTRNCFVGPAHTRRSLKENRFSL